MSKNKALTDDPRQIMIFRGLYSLSDAENLSIVISGRDSLDKARNILAKVGSDYRSLAQMSYNDLVREGLSYGQATRIIACNEYAKRKQIHIADERDQIKMSKDVFDIMSPILSDLQYEEFWTLMLNRSNKVLCKHKLSQGGLSGTVTDVRILFKKALDVLASGMVLCHNHPSGNLQPSESDISITKKIKEAGILMDVQILDHIIINDKTYFSFADDGIL
jgi:DNA repair protein RadC